MGLEAFLILVVYGSPLFLLGVTYVIGSTLERGHDEDINRREKASRSFPVLNVKQVPENWTVTESDLVTANVVISVDYFKRAVAGLKAIFGGRLTTYEPLLDRARREAVLRLKEEAHKRGFHAIINLRLATTTIGTMQGKQGIGGVELLAIGTAVRRTR